jgi:hypothetical protein
MLCAYGNCQAGIRDYQYAVTVTVIHAPTGRREHLQKFCCHGHAAKWLEEWGKRRRDVDPETIVRDAENAA